MIQTHYDIQVFDNRTVIRVAVVVDDKTCIAYSETSLSCTPSMARQICYAMVFVMNEAHKSDGHISDFMNLAGCKDEAHFQRRLNGERD